MQKLPEVEVVLVCDDVRREITGKDIIIGVYGRDITIPSLPAQFLLALYVRVRFFERNKTYRFEFRVLGNTGQHLTPAVATTITSDENLSATVALTGIPIHIQSFGNVQFQWRLENSAWTTIVEIEVKQGSPTLPSGVKISPLTAS